jgi:aspartate/methionine/tyrosine aminotransferase
MRFCERLIEEYKTLIVPGDFYHAPGYVRVSALPPKEAIEVGLANASALLDKMKEA